MNPIVMPYLNAPAMTRLAVEDVLAQTVPSPLLLLLDNGSQPEGRALGDELMLAQAPSPILTWHHDPPLPALAAVWNRALQFCWDAGASHALVVNNDVRLAPWTYALLLEVLEKTGAWFVTAVGVQPEQYTRYLEGGYDLARQALGEVTESRKDGVRPEGYSYGGPDFSCYLITKECHRWFQFDEGFRPAYHEDNDMHRRIRLAGFGDRIFGVNIPFQHVGSGTLREDAKLRERWAPQFAQCQEYYRSKWGGLPGQETYHLPFDPQAPEVPLHPSRFYLYTGQGKPPYPAHVEQLFAAS